MGKAALASEWGVSAQILLTLPNAIYKTGFVGGTVLAVVGAVTALYTMCTSRLAQWGCM